MTTPAAHNEVVWVEAPARLHFGLLDLRGARGRKFGGIGAAAPGPTLLVSARPAETVSVTGEDAERAMAFADRFLEHHRNAIGRRGAEIHVHRALPAHAGLGSGTQLALAVARALAELHGAPADAPALAYASGRAQRSAIGTWTFAGGGLVVEGGRRNTNAGVGPLLADVDAVLSAEAAAFAQLPPADEREVERIAHIVLMALLPALADDDLATFGSALTEIQAITGRWFAAVQGGIFAPGPSEELIRRMREWGAPGVGQSSWGPAVYGIVEGEDAGRRLTERVQNALSALGVAGSIYSGPFRRDGALVWRGAQHEGP